MKNLINDLKTKVIDVLKELSFYFDDLNESDILRVSDRPDLGDFQCNIAMGLARKVGKNPREIASEIVEKLAQIEIFEKVDIAGPGFINILLKDDYLSKKTKDLLNDDRMGIVKSDNPKTIVVDYGGLNVAKPMHVGHLRSSVIGEAVKKIARFNGDKVIGDVHLGDWGLQMGQVIEGIRLEQPDLPYFDESFSGEYPLESPVSIEDLERIYPKASGLCKEDEDFLAKAKLATKELQDGRKGYYALWKHFVKVSIDSLKPVLHDLDVEFDLWHGESTVNDLTKIMIDDMKAKGDLELSQGAYIIDVKDLDKKQKDLPPLIMVKSDGAIMYASTDIATIENRKREFNPDEILYVVDDRQSMHFKQVFLAAYKTGIVDESVKLEHLKFGTVNGKDGKPFKTRAGGTMKLGDLVQIAKDEAFKKMEGRDLPIEQKEDIASKVGLAAVKFGDLINDRTQDYVFDVEKFSSFEGKTGPYVLYSVVRMNSILAKAKDQGLDFSAGEDLIIKDKKERDLMLLINQMPAVFVKVYNSKMPHTLVEYMYNLAQMFNKFYKECSILNADNDDVKLSRIRLVSLVKKQMELLLDLIGIYPVEKM